MQWWWGHTAASLTDFIPGNLMNVLDKHVLCFGRMLSPAAWMALMSCSYIIFTLQLLPG